MWIFRNRRSSSGSGSTRYGKRKITWLQRRIPLPERFALDIRIVYDMQIHLCIIIRRF